MILAVAIATYTRKPS